MLPSSNSAQQYIWYSIYPECNALPIYRNLLFQAYSQEYILAYFVRYGFEKIFQSAFSKPEFVSYELCFC